MSLRRFGFSLILFFPLWIFGQVSVNVKVKSESASLTTTLHQISSGQDSEIQILRTSARFSNLSSVKALIRRNLTSVEQSRAFTLEFNSGSSKSIIQSLNASGDFEFVQEVRDFKLHTVHEVEHAGENEPEITNQYFHPLIETFAAWDSSQGEDTVVIGVLDTGLDYDHPEFSGQLFIHPAEDINNNQRFEPWPYTETRNGLSGDLDSLDNDGNGYADDVIGYDFTDQPRSPFGGDYLFPDPDPLDDNRHGTLVAGIIGANASNQYGIAGIAPACRLMIIRAFSASGSGEDDDIARGIVYAADNGVDVLNLSFGDIYPSLMMKEAIRYAWEKGVILVASSGNGTGDDVHYPSNFDEVISVSASVYDSSQQREYLWPLSSFGLTVDLAAPGDGIYTTTLRDTSEGTFFGYFSGTSTAAPMVAAAAGLILSHRGKCTPEQVRGILTSSADDISSTGWDHLTGAGRLNIRKAMTMVGASHVRLTGPSNDEGLKGDSIWITGTALHPEFSSMALEYQLGTSGGSQWETIIDSLKTQVIDDTLALWNISLLADGEYTLRLKVRRTNGATAEDRIRVLIDRTAPQIEIKLLSPCWDNNERKQLIIFRNSDIGKTQVHFRLAGTGNFKTITFDRNTRNGDFLIGKNEVNDGMIEFYLSSTNVSGLSDSTTIDSFLFQKDFIPLTKFKALPYKIPMGDYLNQTYDLDNDGRLEVVLSEYGDFLDFGRLKLIEYNAGEFVEIDSITTSKILIPKDIQDTDNDGNLELLASVNDSVFVFEQNSGTGLPKNLIFSNAGNEYFPSRWADTDGDGDLELILKDFQDYYVFEGAGASWSQAATLPDMSPDYFGSVAPRSLTNDFDQDGLTETVYGDYDGDMLVYEHQSGNSYQLTFIDSTKLLKSGSYLCQGDFNGNGIPEVFEAIHNDFLRNSDFEYDTPHWRLRIWEANGNDSWQKVWEEVLYDNDHETLNEASAFNLDQDVQEEIIFSTFPRTYIIDHDGSDYGMKWFHYGGILNSHVAGDFNLNGINEVAIGEGDSAVFYEFDAAFSGPEAPLFLEGHVDPNETIQLNWLPGNNANEYLIFRGLYSPAGTQISVIDSTSALSYRDSGLVSGTEYLYVILSKNGLSNPPYAEFFSNAVVLKPHLPFTVDSLKAIGDKLLAIWFDEALASDIGSRQYFQLNANSAPMTATGVGDPPLKLILGFEESFLPGINTVAIDSTFRDALGALIDPSEINQSFIFNPDTSQNLYLTSWKSESAKTARLKFNHPLGPSALDINHYTIHPYGTVASISFVDASQQSVIVTVDEVNFGALGNPLSIIVRDVFSVDGVQINEKEGNVATFAAFANDLSEAYVYPNPFINTESPEGIRFANLTKNASIEIFNASGRLINILTENDGDGGLLWNLTDQWGEKVSPGVLIYHIIDPDSGEEVVGKFAIVEPGQ